MVEPLVAAHSGNTGSLPCQPGPTVGEVGAYGIQTETCNLGSNRDGRLAKQEDSSHGQEVNQGHQVSGCQKYKYER